MRKLFIDFDNTIVNTVEATCKLYNKKHLANLNPENIENYNMFPHINMSEEELKYLFADNLLYDYLEFFEGALECLNKLKDNFKIYLVTNCSIESIPPKSKWIQENIPKGIFSGIIFLNIGQGYNKSLINMEDSILIDDHRENHLTSNAKYHFNFKRYEKQNWGPNLGESIEFSKWDDKIMNTILLYK